MSGKKNTFTAVIYPDGKEKEKLYTSEGQWTDVIQIKDHKTKQIIATHDHKISKPSPLIVAPVEQQDDFETRRAWKKVADAIVKGDMDTTSYEKTIIENRQREMRKEEKEAGREWERTFFTRIETNPLFERLASKVGEKINDSLTNGIWIFDEKKASAAKPPYHPDVQPPIYELKN